MLGRGGRGCFCERKSHLSAAGTTQGVQRHLGRVETLFITGVVVLMSLMFFKGWSPKAPAVLHLPLYLTVILFVFTRFSQLC